MARGEIRELCRKAYRDFIESQPIPEELKRSLRAHERVPVFIDNLARELSPEHLKVSRDSIILAVNDMTRLFIAAVQKKAEERVMSPIRIAVKKAEAARIAEMKKLSEAFDKQGVENVTHDKAGNETSRQVIEVEKVKGL